jgi:predicted lactoylglutathione lyase
MATQIFVNLPVSNLPASIEFFLQLGFIFNPQFTDDTAACMVVSESIYVMLLTHEKFQLFTPNPVSDANKATEVLICLSQPSRAAVDALVRRAIAAGGNTYNQPQEHCNMYGHGFQDLDGHIWELMYMDEPALLA